MIPQVHDDEIQRGEQAPSPIEEKHTPTPASWRRSRNLLLDIFGIVDPLVGTVGQTHPDWPGLRLRIFGVVDPLVGGLVGAIGGFRLEWFLLVMVLSAFVGAILLRSWWALLVVPFAVVIGQVIGQLLSGGFELDIILIAVALPAFFGAALGTAIVKRKDVQG